MSTLIVNRIDDIICEFNVRMKEYIEHNMTKVSARDIGLDSRCGCVYINDECIIVNGSTHPIDYYGGFEYIDSDYRYREVVGDYTIYFAGTERVDACIDYWKVVAPR